MNAMERTVIGIAVMALLFAAGGWLVGWVAVPVLAAVAGLAFPRLRLPSVWIGAAAMLAWGVMLALRGSLFDLTAVLGAATGVPGVVFVVLTLVLPLALGWSAAELGRAALELRRPATGHTGQVHTESAGHTGAGPARQP
jgi:hypothetical protein